MNDSFASLGRPLSLALLLPVGLLLQGCGRQEPGGAPLGKTPDQPAQQAPLEGSSCLGLGPEKNDADLCTAADKSVGTASPPQQVNVLGSKLELCSSNPVTGWFRDGYCRTDAQDHGSHTVCAEMSESFLEFTRERGNDLSTPRPGSRFPGLKPGDRWCLCSARWLEALRSDRAPGVVLAASDSASLKVVKLKQLKEKQSAK